jgi:hypothetical protein
VPIIQKLAVGREHTKSPVNSKEGRKGVAKTKAKVKREEGGCQQEVRWLYNWRQEQTKSRLERASEGVEKKTERERERGREGEGEGEGAIHHHHHYLYCSLAASVSHSLLTHLTPHSLLSPSPLHTPTEGSIVWYEKGRKGGGGLVQLRTRSARKGKGGRQAGRQAAGGRQGGQRRSGVLMKQHYYARRTSYVLVQFCFLAILLCRFRRRFL